MWSSTREELWHALISPRAVHVVHVNSKGSKNTDGVQRIELIRWVLQRALVLPINFIAYTCCRWPGADIVDRMLSLRNKRHWWNVILLPPPCRTGQHGHDRQLSHMPAICQCAAMVRKHLHAYYNFRVLLGLVQFCILHTIGNKTRTNWRFGSTHMIWVYSFRFNRLTIHEPVAS